MKKCLKFLGASILALSIVACGSRKRVTVAPTNYQVYTVEALGGFTKTENSLLFEDENLEVHYDFWTNKGGVGFYIYNKSEKDVVVNLAESFFIYNSVAFDYFKNRVFISETSNSTSNSSTTSSTNSTSSTKTSSFSMSAAAGVSGVPMSGGGNAGGALGAGGGASRSKMTTNTTTDTQTSTKINSVTSGVNIFEKETLFIPAKSGRFFLEYYISESVYETREMKKTDFKGITFSESTSPIVFGNRISYSVKGSNKSIMLSHNFYVSEIRNYMRKDITEMVSDPNAVDPKRAPKIEYYKDNSPNKFFIKY